MRFPQPAILDPRSCGGLATGQATTPYSWLIFGGRGYCARLQTVPRTQIRTITDSPFNPSVCSADGETQHAALAVPRPGLFVLLAAGKYLPRRRRATPCPASPFPEPSSRPLCSTSRTPRQIRWVEHVYTVEQVHIP